jgi:hypothetical protein
VPSDVVPKDFDIHPIVPEKLNDPRVRATVIQDTIGYLRRPGA